MPQSAERGTLYPDRLATKEKEYFIPQILPFPIEIGGDRLVALQTHHKINQGNPFVVHPLEEHEVSGVKNLTRETVETLTGLPQALIGNHRL